MTPATGTRPFLATFALVLLAIAALFAIDTFLERTERVESEAEAARLFAEGRDLMGRGNNAEAIERLRDAGLIDRNNRDFQRTLAEAQLAAGKTADAETTLSDLLESDSTDGLANLLMARVLVKKGQLADAASYFHRAIYGRWTADAAGNRLRTRFELIDLLAAQNAKEELLAEVLGVQDQAPQDLPTRMRIGRLFLQAGSPARAADVFQGVVHDAPSNSQAHAGLGEAEFLQGNYRAAQQDFGVALRLTPDDSATRRRLEVCDDLLRLDPTIRGLSAPDRFQRSRGLLAMTVEETNKCAGPNPSADLGELIGKANNAVKAHVSGAREGEAAQSDLDLAAQLWQARRKECKAPPDANSPLSLVLARLAQ